MVVGDLEVSQALSTEAVLEAILPPRPSWWWILRCRQGEGTLEEVAAHQVVPEFEGHRLRNEGDLVMTPDRCGSGVQDLVPSVHTHGASAHPRMT